MSPGERLFLIGVFKPFGYLIYALMIATIIWAIARYFPDGALKRFLLFDLGTIRRRYLHWKAERAEAKRRAQYRTISDRGRQ